MAVQAWPSALPPLIGLAASLGTSQLYQPAQTTQMDDGPGRTRRRTLTNETARSIVLVLTRAEFEAFDFFARVTLNDGARRFTAPVRLKNGTVGPRVCRIAGAVTEQDLGPHSRVAFTLTIYDW